MTEGDCQAFYRENVGVFGSEPKPDSLWRQLAKKCLCEKWGLDSSKNPVSGESLDTGSDTHKTIEEWIRTWCQELELEGDTVTVRGVPLPKSVYQEKIEALAALGLETFDIIQKRIPASIEVRKEEAQKVKDILTDEMVGDPDNRSLFRLAMIELARKWIREHTVTIEDVTLSKREYDEKIEALVGLGKETLEIVQGSKTAPPSKRQEEALKMKKILPNEMVEDDTDQRIRFRKRMMQLALKLIWERGDWYRDSFVYQDEFQSRLEKPLLDYFDRLGRRPVCLREIVEHIEYHKVSQFVKYRLIPIVIAREGDQLGKSYITRLIESPVETTTDSKEHTIWVSDAALQYALKEHKDIRLESFVELFRLSINWAVRNRVPLPSKPCLLFVWISDRAPWEEKLVEKPIFLVSYPSQHSFPLLPDSTYTRMQFGGKYEGEYHTWDRVKELMEEFKVDYESKERALFFRGTPTTIKESKVRQSLEFLSQKEVEQHIFHRLPEWLKRKNARSEWRKRLRFPLSVDLSGRKEFVPLFEQQRFKYNIDLPGHYPWSVRFKFLFLMKSSVIKVNEMWYSEENKWKDQKWVQLFDHVVDKDDYHVVNFYYNQDANNEKAEKKYAEKGKAHNREAFQKLIADLNSVISRIDAQPERELRRIDLAYQKASQLTNDRIYQYTLQAIWKSSRVNWSLPS
jgi:hypothetical protein